MARGRHPWPPPPSPLPLRHSPVSSDERISLFHPCLRPLLFCRTLRQLTQAQARLVVCGLFFGDTFAASRVLKAAADLGCLEHAALVFRHLRPAADAFCANTLLKAESLSGAPARAVAFFFELAREGFAHNSFAFPPLLNACARSRSLGDGGKCHGQAVKNGVDGVVHVENALVNMYASCGAPGLARSLFDEMPTRDACSWNSMIDGYVKCGDLPSASRLFDEMPDRTVISWNVMISGFVKGRTPERGLELFREMVRSGVKGTATTLVSAATACARLGRLNQGRSVHGFWLKNFVQRLSNVILETALVDMYSKCLRLETARSVFDRIQGKNVVSWNAMILGYCIHGCPEEGLALFGDMAAPPDEVTFVGVLCACSRAGRLAEGKLYFEEMGSRYGVARSFAHYWCMANLYAGAGLAGEAEGLLRSMPEERQCLVWASMFWLCRFRNDVGPGEQIARRLIELQPFNCAFYALLWNVYVAAGRWEDAGKVTEAMRARGLAAVHSRCLVDLTELVHNFKVTGLEGVCAMMEDLAAGFGFQREDAPELRVS
ncbi:pentatricopeptide repeat (PPR) superfamily protein [Wolffia australiana]